MQTIYKYALPIKDKVSVMMPGGGEHILLVAEQNGSLTVWAQVDTEKPDRARVLHIVGTGHPLDNVKGMFHIGSAIVGQYVWHVYSKDL